MFSYPLIINTKEEHLKHIKDNIEFYEDILFDEHLKHKKQKTEPDENIEILQNKINELENTKKQTNQLQLMMEKTLEQMDELKRQKEEQQKELLRTKEILEDTVTLEELLKKKNGISVVNKGICDEKYVEVIMKEVASELYNIDNSDGIRKMDVRLHRKDGAFSIGIECKDKDNITKTDIDKFRRDKVLNKFYRSIFISTCPIKHIAEEDNSVTTKGDELYIITKDPVFLGGVMRHFLSQLEEDDGKDPNNMVFDTVMDVYTTWQTTKKQITKMDKSCLRMMGLHPDFTEKMLSKHVYLTTRNNIKDKFKY